MALSMVLSPATELQSEKQQLVIKPPKETSKHYKDWPNDAGFEADAEQLEPIELIVRGVIPASAAGVLYRTGPGHYKVADAPNGTYSCSHWFDGFTHLHRFQLIATPEGSCKVMYNSRRQVDALIENVRKTGQLHGITFGQKRDPCATFFQKLKTVFAPVTSSQSNPGLANVGVTVHANIPGSLKAPEKDLSSQNPPLDSLTSLTDARHMKLIDPETLQPLGVTQQQDLHPDLNGPVSCAHPELDPSTGDLYNFNLAMGKNSTYRIFRTSSSNLKTEIVATISGAGINPAYLHSFFLSEDFIILCIWSSHFLTGGARILWERNILDAMKFDPKAPAKWVVVDRKHSRGVIATFSSPAFFSFHTINAWQQDNGDEVDIMCDLIQYPDMDILSKTYYENLVSTGPGVEKYAGKIDSQPSFARYRLAGIPKVDSGMKAKEKKSPRSAELLLQVPSPKAGELPTMNPRFATKKTRYVYAIADRGLSSFFDCIAKLDLETQEVKYWGHPKHTPGEAIFVPDGADELEDSGFLLSVVLNGETGTSYLICLNARDMTEMGRAECNVAVGIGFHGSHYSSK